MGTFHVDAEIAGIRRADKTVKAPKLLVDSGAEFTWVPGELLKRAGITVAKKDQAFVMANGQTIHSHPVGCCPAQTGRSCAKGSKLVRKRAKSEDGWVLHRLEECEQRKPYRQRRWSFWMESIDLSERGQAS